MNTQNNNKLFSATNSGITINTIAQAEYIAEHAFNIRKTEYCEDDTLERYYTKVAACMARIGNTRMELKCRIKSLLQQYEDMWCAYEDTISIFISLHSGLTGHGYAKAAERLLRYHLKVTQTLSDDEQWQAKRRDNYKGNFTDKVTPKLRDYLEEYIISKYREYRSGYVKRNIEYIADLALRVTVEFEDRADDVSTIKTYYPSYDALYTAAVFHRLSMIEGECNYKRSAAMLFEDYHIRTLLSEKEIKYAVEAIEDLDLPSKEDARTSYGRLLRTAVDQSRDIFK